MWLTLLAFLADPPRKPAKRSPGKGDRTPNLVFWAVVVLTIAGVGWKALQAFLARRSLQKIEGDRPDLGAIAESANHGRAAIVDLFRLLAAGKDEAVRREAGRALATLWKKDELVAEEEKALVTRGFEARWQARRRYPRDLRVPIPFSVAFDIPFLEEDGPGVAPHALEWSARVLGTDRASLEQFEKWQAGGGTKTFEIDPRDRTTNGPHRVIVDLKVRTVGLTSDWEHTLPQVPFTFEFDLNLRPEALLATADETRSVILQSAILLSIEGAGEESARFLPIDAEFAIRGTPQLVVRGGLPCDLAHSVVLEVEGAVIPLEVGGVVAIRDAEGKTVPLEPSGERLGLTVERPGNHRIRAVLMPNVHLGWSDPAVRSIWPGILTTEWVEVRVVRR